MTDTAPRLSAARAVPRTASDRRLPLALLVVVGLLAACAPMPSRDVATAPESPAVAPAVQAFASPEDAVVALIEACRSGDPARLAPLFGASADDLAGPDDGPVGADMQRLAAAYDRAHLLVAEDDGSVTLWIGARQWSFPAPLVNSADGWVFDGATGAAVMRERAMDDNEAAAASYLRWIGDATDVPQDPVFGYRFAVLVDAAGDGGPTVIAWPERYDVDGRTVFVLAPDGAIHQRDFGEAVGTDPLLPPIDAFTPSADWSPYLAGP